MNFFEEHFKMTFSGPMRGDCCCHFIYKAIPSKPVTVQQMCEYILSTNQWGYIGINRPRTIFGEPHVEYLNHEYVDENRKPIQFKFPTNIAHSIIRQIDWDGGWGRGDWLFTLY